MERESDFKRAFKKSVITGGGHALSLAAPMIVGIPDLYCLLPKYIPILLEAKWLGKIERDTFKRKVPYTEMQKLWIKDCHNVLPFSAMGLVGLQWQNVVYAIMVPYGSEFFESITHEFVERAAFSTLTSKRFHVQSMLEKIPVPQLTEYHALSGRHSRTISGALGVDANTANPPG